MPYSFATLKVDQTEDEYKLQFESLKRKPHGFSVNEMDADSGEPLIVKAAKLGYVNAVLALLSDPELNVNAIDSQNCTALHYACANKSNKQFLLIKELLKHRNKSSGQIADISLLDNQNKIPFDYLPIAVCGEKETRLHEPDIAQKLIYHVCRCGRLDAFKQLHSKIKQSDPRRVFINDYDPVDESSTPLHLAVNNGHIDIVSALLESDVGVDIHKKQAGKGQNSALHIAAFMYRPEIVALLLSKNANPYEANGENETPFMFAFRQRLNDDESIKKLERVIKIFFELPHSKFFTTEDIKRRQATNGNTYLHLAIKSLKPPTIVQYLLDKIPNNDSILNAENKEQKTPLQYAAEYHSENIPQLIKKGVNLVLNNSDCPTILHYIFKNNCLNALDPLKDNLTAEKFTELMTQKSATTKETVLHLAAKGDINDLVKMLTKLDDNQKKLVEENPKNALINTVDAEGDTPLHSAIIANNIRNVEELIKHKASLEVRNKNENTVFDLAVKEKHYDILVKLLEKLNQGELLRLVQQRNNTGSTILHEAAKVEGPEDYKGDTENILNLLLMRIANTKQFSNILNMKDGEGKSLVEIALSHKNYRNYLVLLEKGMKFEPSLDVQQAILKVKRAVQDRHNEFMRAEKARIENARAIKAREDKFREERAKFATMRKSDGGENKRASVNLTGLKLPTTDSQLVTDKIGRRSSFAGTTSTDTSLASASSSLHLAGGIPPANHSPHLPAAQQAPGDLGTTEPISDLPPDPSSVPSSTPSSARSLAQLTEDTHTLLGYDKRNKNYLSTFTRLRKYIGSSSVWQHIVRNKYKYLVGGIGGLLLLTGFLALCVFCPPVAAKIAVLALVKTIFIKTNLATATTAWLQPVAQAVTVAAPIAISTILGVATLSVTWVVCKMTDAVKGIPSFFADKSKDETPVINKDDYRPVATEEPVNKHAVSNSHAPAPDTAENLHGIDKPKTSDENEQSGFRHWFNKVDKDYLQPFGNAVKSNLCFFCCGHDDTDEEDEDVEQQSNHSADRQAQKLPDSTTVASNNTMTI